MAKRRTKRSPAEAARVSAPVLLVKHYAGQPPLCVEGAVWPLLGPAITGPLGLVERQLNAVEVTIRRGHGSPDLLRQTARVRRAVDFVYAELAELNGLLVGDAGKQLFMEQLEPARPEADFVYA
jgi:hypothetical protein